MQKPDSSDAVILFGAGDLAEYALDQDIGPE
jgi:hypothetical protein